MTDLINDNKIYFEKLKRKKKMQENVTFLRSHFLKNVTS